MIRNYKIILFLLVAALTAMILFASVNRDVNADQQLPPRPTAVPTAEVIPPPPTEPPYVARGGFIMLEANGFSKDLWTVIQWRDEFDNWHTISGWQGNFNETGQVLWWVAPEDLGKGPFRWLVLPGPDEKPIATSETFFLPNGNSETVRLNVALQEK